MLTIRMTRTRSRRPGLWGPVLGVVLSQALLAFAVACASGAVVAPEPTVPPGSDAPPASQSTPDIKVGSLVGERVPDFEMYLVDRSTVTSASLLSQDKPVFLYFFATW